MNTKRRVLRDDENLYKLDPDGWVVELLMPIEYRGACGTRRHDDDRTWVRHGVYGSHEAAWDAILKIRERCESARSLLQKV